MTRRRSRGKARSRSQRSGGEGARARGGAGKRGNGAGGCRKVKEVEEKGARAGGEKEAAARVRGGTGAVAGAKAEA